MSFFIVASAKNRERNSLILPCILFRIDYYCLTNLTGFFPLFRYYAAFPALSTQTAESLIHGTATNLQPPVNNVWAKKKHLLTAAATWSDEHDSGSSSRDSSGEVRRHSRVRFIHSVPLRKRNFTLVFCRQSVWIGKLFSLFCNTRSEQVRKRLRLAKQQY